MSLKGVPAHTLNNKGEVMIPVMLTRDELELIIRTLDDASGEIPNTPLGDDLCGVSTKLVDRRKRFNKVQRAVDYANGVMRDD